MFLVACLVLKNLLSFVCLLFVVFIRHLLVNYTITEFFSDMKAASEVTQLISDERSVDAVPGRERVQLYRRR